MGGLRYAQDDKLKMGDTTMTSVSLQKNLLVGIGASYAVWIAVTGVLLAMNVLRGRATGITFVASPGLLLPLLVGTVGGCVWYWITHR